MCSIRLPARYQRRAIGSLPAVRIKHARRWSSATRRKVGFDRAATVAMFFRSGSERSTEICRVAKGCAIGPERRLISSPQHYEGVKMAADAGWYDDGLRPGFLRWWDGQVWTDRYEPAPHAPAPAPAPAPGLPQESMPSAPVSPETSPLRRATYRFPSSTGWPNVEVTGDSNYG
jgi:hypothetical protein